MGVQAKTRDQLEQQFKRRYEKLNNAQREAVDTIDGVVMVVAGPGTGKTELLALRAANIVRTTQLDPWNVLCLTFTESGVKALRERLASIMGPAGYQVRVHTFHSFCGRVMQEFPEAFKKVSYGEPLSDVERVALLEDLLAELPATSLLKPFGNPHLFLKDIVSAIQQLKQEHIEPTDLARVLKDTEALLTRVQPAIDAFAAHKPKERTQAHCEDLYELIQKNKKQWPRLAFHFSLLEQTWLVWREQTSGAENERTASRLRTQLKNDVVAWARRTGQHLKRQQDVVKIYKKYQSALEQQGRFDFEDMITSTLAALKENDDLRANYQETFQYILADEYQDTNGAQNELLFALTEQHDEPNLCVVGDDQQAIYRFQGASLENMVTLTERYPHTRAIVLMENYRSQQTILDAATEFIAHNETSLADHLSNLDRALTAQATRQSQPLEVHHYSSLTAEEAGLAQELEQELKAGVQPSELAVLTRRNREAVEIADALRRIGLPVQLVTDEHIFDEQAIQQFMDVLQYVQTGEEALLHRLLHLPWLVDDALDTMQLQVAAREQRKPLRFLMRDRSALEKAGVHNPDLFVKMINKLADWRRRAATHQLPDTIATILSESGLLAYLTDSEHNGDAIRFIRALFDEARRVAARQPEARLAEFLAHLRFIRSHGLRIPVASPEASTDSISVMTAHRAKGLEFTSVFLPRAHDTIWGNMRTSSGVVLPHGLVSHETLSLDANEDERRLFYVALTRAKQRVVISHADANRDGRPLILSSFVSELPQAHISPRDMSKVASAEETVQFDGLKPLPVRSKSELETFAAGLLSNYTMSVTHLNNYLRCPRLFFFRNLLREPAVKTKHMAFGTAVHAALRDLFSTFDEHSAKTRSTYLTSQFDFHLSRELLAKDVEAETRAFGHEVLANYLKEYGSKWNGVVLTEYDFRPHAVQVGGVHLTGLLDKVELPKGDSKDVVVVDYKTGQPDNKGKELKPGGEYWRQLVFYQLLCDNSDQFPYKMIAGEIDFVQPNRKGKFVKKRIEISDEDTEQVTEEIVHTWQAMQNLEFLDPAKTCGSCEYCA